MTLALLGLAAACGGSGHQRPNAGGGGVGTGGAGTGGVGTGGAAGDHAGSGGLPGGGGAPGSGGLSGGGGAAGGGAPPGTGGATGAAGSSTGGSASGGASSMGGATAGSGGATATGGAAPGSGGAGGAAVKTCPAVACVSGLVCERYGGGVCADADWAAWPMPNSPVDVAAGAPNPTTYVDNGDGTVTDSLTRLMWQQVPPSTAFPSANSTLMYCADLVLAGYDDWRVPSRIELISIVDYGRSSPAIDPVFQGEALDYITSTWTDMSAWTVSFGDGTVGSYGFDTNNRVRCVR